MAEGKFVAYYRVSTARQGQSGLGLEAQRASVLTYLNGGGWKLLGDFTEVETGKGSDALDRRPQLREAIALCRKRKATLVIAKLDRLARNVHFISGLMESKVEFVAADMPEANRLTVHIMAAMAEYERKMISERTKVALAAAKARGVKLGTSGAVNLRSNVEQRQQRADAYASKLHGQLERMRGMSQRVMVDELNSLGIAAPRGGQWHLKTLQRVLARQERLAA